VISYFVVVGESNPTLSAVTDIRKFYDKMVGSGVEFTMRPTKEFGVLLARFLDSEGAECTVAEQ